MSIVLWLLAVLALLAFAYWLVVVGECTYLGRRAVRGLYQLGARVYDDARSHVVANDTALLLPHLHSALAGIAQPRVLDVATGTGRVPLLLVAQLWFDGGVCGVDITLAMLERARLKLREAGALERVELREGEAERLPWPEASFDLVTSLEALEFFPHPKMALREMIRTLRPGGTLIVSKYPDNWARTLPLKGLTRRGMARVLDDAGMSEVVFHAWQPGHYELVVAKKPQSSRSKR